MHIEIKPGEKPIEVLLKGEALKRIAQRASLRGEIELDPKGGREARLTSPGALAAQYNIRAMEIDAAHRLGGAQ